MITVSRRKDFALRSQQCMSIKIINSQVKVFVYVPPREKCVRPTLCPFRVRTHQVLLRTHMCLCLFIKKFCRYCHPSMNIVTYSVCNVFCMLWLAIQFEVRSVVGPTYFRSVTMAEGGRTRIQANVAVDSGKIYVRALLKLLKRPHRNVKNRTRAPGFPTRPIII